MARARVLMVIGFIAFVPRAGAAGAPSAEPANAADAYVAAVKAYVEPADYDLLNTEPRSPLPDSLEPALQANQRALELLIAGSTKARCVFASAKAPAIGPEAPGIELLRLAKLLMLRARSRYSGGQEGLAVSDLQAALHLANHLSQVPDVVSRAVASKLEELTVATFESFSPASKTACRAFGGAVEEHLSRRLPASGIVDAHRQYARLALKSALGKSASVDGGLAALESIAGARIDAWLDAHLPYATTHRSVDKKPIDEANEKLGREKKGAFEMVGTIPPNGDFVGAAVKLIASGRLTRSQVESLLSVLLTASVAVDLTSPIDAHFEGYAALQRARSVTNGCR